MKAIGYQQTLPITDRKALEDIELPTPNAHGHDILVKVAAISVNPVDTKIRQRKQPEAGQHVILGWDAVGEVVAIGDQVSLFKVGDTVWYAGDLTRDGSNAEYQLVDERIVGYKPKTLSNTEAAALPLTAITAWELLFDRFDFEPNTPHQSVGPRPTILIVGAAGGVGSILTQLAKQLTDAVVIGTASRPETQEWVKELGADYVVDHQQPLAPQLAECGITEVSHAICLNQTDQHFEQLAELVAPQGKFALIDDPIEPIDILKLKQKSISLHWEFMYTRSMFATWDIAKQHALLNAVAELVDAGKIKTTLGENYGVINAANLIRAHAHIESNTAVGKVVLEGFA